MASRPDARMRAVEKGHTVAARPINSPAASTAFNK
jgi:hypothetical protein